MAKYKSKKIIEATQWFKNGDHPKDGDSSNEGKVVKYFKPPFENGKVKCSRCNKSYHDHGWLTDNNGTGTIICPGDYIITKYIGHSFRYSSLHPSIFNEEYEISKRKFWKTKKKFWSIFSFGK